VWFDKPVLSNVEGLTTNEINYLPFVLSLPKDLFSVSLRRIPRCYTQRLFLM